MFEYNRLTQYKAAIDRHGDCNINTASDFIAQYTTRQEYKYADALPDYNQEWAKFRHMSTLSSESSLTKFLIIHRWQR